MTSLQNRGLVHCIRASKQLVSICISSNPKWQWVGAASRYSCLSYQNKTHAYTPLCNGLVNKIFQPNGFSATSMIHNSPLLHNGHGKDNRQLSQGKSYQNKESALDSTDNVTPTDSTLEIESQKLSDKPCSTEKDTYLEKSALNDGDIYARSKAEKQTQNDNFASETVSFATDQPRMAIVYTCKVCDTRSAKTFTRHSYEKGIVIVECPGCKSNHLIADHLNWFKHIKHRNIEDLLAAKGESVKRVRDEHGTLEITAEDVIGQDNMDRILENSPKTE